MKWSFWILAWLWTGPLMAQSRLEGAETALWVLEGWVVKEDGSSLEGASIYIPTLKKGTHGDQNGWFRMEGLGPAEVEMRISALGFIPQRQKADLRRVEPLPLTMVRRHREVEEVVITATKVAVRKEDSPVPVEIYESRHFEKNPSGNLFASLGMVNGVQPQLNCQVCNTGDIHINGMEGPYTMVLIDGMPIVSGLSTVYGLSGIPNRMIERIELVKGPASALYGSEAMGGIINVITRSPQQENRIALDMMGTSWGEGQGDLGLSIRKEKWASLHGLSLYHYGQSIDWNGDGFTDLTAQHRWNLF